MDVRQVVVIALDTGGDIIGVYVDRESAEADLEADLPEDEDVDIQYQEWPVRGI